MGQAFPSSARCESCGALKVMVRPTSDAGPRMMRCQCCDEIDPLQLPQIGRWIDSELKPPK